MLRGPVMATRVRKLLVWRVVAPRQAAGHPAYDRWDAELWLETDETGPMKPTRLLDVSRQRIVGLLDELFK